jgi:Ca-activated chloride channel family protein
MKTVLSVFSIMILAAIMIAFTESRTITGEVKDTSGQPLYGVMVKSQPCGTVTTTDRKGYYRIIVGSQAKTLVFSIPGYVTVTEKIGTGNVINIYLSVDILPSEDVTLMRPDKRRDMAQKSLSGAAVPYSVMSYESQNIFHGFNNDFDTEGYASVNENGFRNVFHTPLSTFSIDVDNASYSNIRRFINMGQLPPADAVRIEEMINYFRYDYPEPSEEHPFSVYTELAVCPWNTKHQLLHVGLKGKSIEKTSLPPSNLVFLIDVSGSMNSPNKLPLLKSAFKLLVNELRPHDRVAIVVYAGAAGLVLDSTPGNMKEAIMAAIDNLQAGGSTAGGAGLKLAYSVAQKNFVKEGNNRIILASDGDFNVGESSNGGMERLVEEKREQGVFITVLGFGMGNYKDDKMEIIANKGNGNYSYIDNLQEARRVLVREFGGTLYTIAKDVKFQIEFNPARVQSYRLIGYENRLLNDEDFNDDKKDAGEMGAGHNVTALYELIPAGSDEEIPSVDPLRYQSNKGGVPVKNDHSGEYLTIKLRYKKPDGEKSILLDRPVRGPVKSIDNASDNLKFASAVTEFGMMLRNSEFKGNSTFEGAAQLAGTAKSGDDEGYRAEMIRLIITAKDLRVTAERE